MQDKTTIHSTGIGFSGLLQVAFIVLKLLGKIDWSWFWVLAPAWISFGIAIIIMVIAIILSCLK